MNRVSLPDIAFFHELADAAKIETMSRFRCGEDIHIGSKPKEGYRFDPVTDADREAERVIRALIEKKFPEHMISGEEFGETGGSTVCWVLDPVDGTRPFLCGLPVWGTLIGLYEHNRAVMGMMCQPLTKERFWADASGAWYRGHQDKLKLQTRIGVAVEDAILHTTSPEPIATNQDVNFTALSERVLMTRYGGECYAMAMLAAGHIDVCVEYSLQAYDIAAFIPIIEQAGGVVTTLSGGRPENGGRIVASGCGKLHEKVLSILTSTK